MKVCLLVELAYGVFGCNVDEPVLLAHYRARSAFKPLTHAGEDFLSRLAIEALGIRVADVLPIAKREVLALSVDIKDLEQLLFLRRPQLRRGANGIPDFAEDAKAFALPMLDD